MAIRLEDLTVILLEAVPPEAPRAYDGDAPLTDAGLDSLDVSNFLLMVEEKYGIQISNEEIETLNTLNDVLVFVNARIA